ncbi:hypothetical protein EON65_36335 [archaeon]|nr:MAG: hypothetical protein EON65_36335 [archaeon]
MVDFDKCYLYVLDGDGYKPVMSATSVGNLEAEIRNHVEAPEEAKKVFIFSFNRTENKERFLMIGSYQNTITPKLALVNREGDNGIMVTYSKKLLEKRRFRLSDVLKIIKAIVNREISFSSSRCTISEILCLN